MKSSVFADVMAISEKLSWKLSLMFTIGAFIVFYVVLPGYFEALIERSSGRGFVEAVIGRRIIWVKYLGVCLGVVGLWFAMRKFILSSRASSGEKSIARLIAKYVGRNSEL